MRQILDLHIHSKFSRSCSPDLELPKIATACREKGINVVATGDFTHPAWFGSIESELEEIESSGLYRLKGGREPSTKFILATELALIYKDGGRARRLHLMVQAPNLDAVRELNKQLGRRFNLKADGRPILGLPADELVRLCLTIHPQFTIYPAHIWTPWFSVFGSKSGYNSFFDCFKNQTAHIYAYETGLSSDPEMNWRVSALDPLALLSNSDAHSLPNLGREANIFELEEVTYQAIYEAIRSRQGLIGTIEFYPEEGMYHYDGHRNCGVSFSPTETEKLNGSCPVCKKPIVIGVASRVAELADRPEGFARPGAPSFRKLIELDKIIAETLGVKSRTSPRVRAMYRQAIDALGPELDILLKAKLEDIAAAGGEFLAEAVRRMRAGELIIKPGFDGQYGEIRIFDDEERPRKVK